MQDQIRHLLKRIRYRVRLEHALQGLVLGLVVGCCLALLHVMASVAAGIGGATVGSLTVVVCGGLGTAIGFFRSQSWQRIATVADRRFELKDRVATALELSAGQALTDIQVLQIQDACQMLKQALAATGVPFHRPKYIGWSVLAVVIAVTLQLVPWGSDTLVAEAALTHQGLPSGVIERIEDSLEELEQLAEESEDEEFKKLSANMRELTVKLRSPQMELDDALETMSEMQQRLAKQQAEFDIAKTDAQLKSLGEALDGPEVFRTTSEALQQGDLDKAEKSLQSLKSDDLEQADTEKVARNLEDVAQEMKQSSMDSLSEAVDDLAQAAEQKSADRMQAAAEELAEDVRAHAARKTMSEFMDQQKELLAEMKLQSRGGAPTNRGGDSRNGSNSNSLAKGKTTKRSSNASTSAGAKEAGNIRGAQTELDSERRLDYLKGQLGTVGESDKETVSSAEGEAELAERAVREQLQEYVKQSEAVLEAESIPVGRRQVIRRYFEQIRPADAALDSEKMLTNPPQR